MKMPALLTSTSMPPKAAATSSTIDWMDAALNPDLFVMPSQDIVVRTLRFPRDMEAEIAALPGVARVQAVVDSVLVDQGAILTSIGDDLVPLLDALAELLREKLIPNNAAESLHAAYLFFRRLIDALRMARGTADDPCAAPEGGLRAGRPFHAQRLRRVLLGEGRERVDELLAHRGELREQVVQRLAERGAICVVFEQNDRPYGKVEDGLPRWHVGLRRKEYDQLQVVGAVSDEIKASELSEERILQASFAEALA